ncbi:hypothetical protein [Paenibacillus sp. PL91]|uniref:hypothetical protein n=1 Tax=Paenibacillus sp. PL91 TaxID=2729538 RepID=UPI00145C96B7|nr:hypothetical protein [Paenibacillus sp. PL91]MBC9203697.1 hypothetical protein [Paenibacillus sp. PL91]
METERTILLRNEPFIDEHRRGLIGWKINKCGNLLEWIENSKEADGFWLGTCAFEAFDNLKDAIETGHLDSN